MVDKDDMHDTDHQTLLDLVPAYALGALDDTERAGFEAHLEDCEICQSELRAYARVADLLALAAPETEPDPALRGEVMARASKVRSKFAPRQPAPTRRWLDGLRASVRLPLWGLGAAILLFAALITGAYFSDLDGSASSSQVVLSQPSGAEDAEGLLVLSAQGNNATLIVENLPQLDAAHRYQLWLIKDDGQRANGGLFSVSEEGYQSLAVFSPQPFDSYVGYGITVEPWAGSDGPTGDPVLVSQ